MSTAKFIPLDALATTLGLPRRWLRGEAMAGRIPSLIVGNRRLFNPDAVRQALERRAAQPGTTAEIIAVEVAP